MDSELSAVNTELERISQGKDRDKGTKKRQLALFKALTKDVSEPTVTLVAKLNCETKREEFIVATHWIPHYFNVSFSFCTGYVRASTRCFGG